MALSVAVDGLDSLVKDAKQQGAHAERLVRAALVNSTNRIQSNTRRLAPHKTGTLQRSILPNVSYPNAQVEVNEKYGQYIEYGTGIYGKTGNRITPKTKKALYFKVAGQPVFARSVKGMKAKPFFKPGVEQSQVYIHEQFVKVIELLVKGLAGK